MGTQRNQLMPQMNPIWITSSDKPNYPVEQPHLSEATHHPIHPLS
jgi:hypothetical protein